MNIQHDIGKVYSDFLNDENRKNFENRYVGKEHYYHGSGAGKCSRLIFFKSVEIADASYLRYTASL